jgi:hypothetical protein
MHKTDSRTYAAAPGETVTLSTTVGGGGQISVALDGQTISANGAFQLPAQAGAPSTLQIALVGPAGASCVVGLAVVDGGTDGDLLLCQTHAPAPVHFYRFSVASQVAIGTLAATRAGKPANTGRRRP